MFDFIGEVNSATTRHSRILQNLCQIAEQVEPVNSARLAAAVVYKNKVISYGTNKLKTHTFQSKFGKNEHAIFLHAETDAIKNALRYIHVDNLAHCYLYVARVKRSRPRSKFICGLARPCKGCMHAISSFNIKGVVHTLDDKEYQCF